MPKTFKKADEQSRKLFDRATKNWHPEIVAANLRVALIFVEPACNKDGEPSAPAITTAGMRVAAKTRCVTRKRRVYNPHDVEIEIDALLWGQLSEQERLALLDHELHHVEVFKSKSGAFLTENDDRPVVRLFKDDYMLTGFVAVAKRHGESSLEVKAMKILWDSCGQALFPWANPQTRKTRASKVA